MKLHVILTGCPQDHQQILALNHELNLRIPAIFLQTLPYSNLLSKMNSSQPNSLFVIFSKYLLVDTYLNQVLNKIQESKLRAIFYPLAINKNYTSAGTWKQIIRNIESVRDRMPKKTYQMVVYFLNNSDRGYRQSMSMLYSKFINNQNVKFYNINKIQELMNELAQKGNDEVGNQKRTLIVSGNDAQSVKEIQKFMLQSNQQKIEILVFNPKAGNNSKKQLQEFTSVIDLQNHIGNNLKNIVRSNQSLSSSKYSSLSVDSRSSKNSQTSTNKLSKIHSNKLIENKIELGSQSHIASNSGNVRLIVVNNIQNQGFKALYQKLPLSVAPTVVTQIPSSLPNDKPTIIFSPVENKTQILRLYPSVDCIFFTPHPQNHQGMKNHNILITNSEIEIQEFMITRGVSFIRQSSDRSPNSRGKSVKFADEIELKNSPFVMSSSESSLLNTDNSNIIKNLNKKKKKKPFEQIQEVMNEYDIAEVGLTKNQSKQSVPSLMVLPASSSFSHLPSGFVSPSKPTKELKIQKTLNIHTNPRPVSSATSISQNFHVNSQSSISQAPTIPTIKKAPDTDMHHEEIHRLQTAKPNNNIKDNMKQRVSIDNKNNYNFKESSSSVFYKQKQRQQNYMLTAKFDRTTSTRPVSNSPVYSPHQIQTDRNSYYSTSQLPSAPPSYQSPPRVTSFSPFKGKASQIINKPSVMHQKLDVSPIASNPSNKSIIDAITPLTQQQQYPQIIFKQKYSGFDKKKSNLFIIPQLRQSYLESIKKIAQITDEIVSYRNQKSLEKIQYQNYRLAFVFDDNKMKHVPELCHYIPNLYMVRIGSDHVNTSCNVKQITVGNVSQLKQTIRKMHEIKPTTFSFCPKQTQFVGSTSDSKAEYSLEQQNEYQYKISQDRQLQIPVVLFSSLIAKQIYQTLTKKFSNQISSCIYSNQQSLLNQLKIHKNRTVIVLIQQSLVSSISNIFSLNKNAYILIFILQSRSEIEQKKILKLTEKYERNSKVKMVRSVPELMDEIEFLARI